MMRCLVWVVASGVVAAVIAALSVILFDLPIHWVQDGLFGLVFAACLLVSASWLE